jgi:hypothetical protein
MPVPSYAFLVLVVAYWFGWCWLLIGYRCRWVVAGFRMSFVVVEYLLWAVDNFFSSSVPSSAFFAKPNF